MFIYLFPEQNLHMVTLFKIQVCTDKKNKADWNESVHLDIS